MANSRFDDRSFNPYDLNSVAEASRELRAGGAFVRRGPYIPPRPRQEQSPQTREDRQGVTPKPDR
jgi:hypothetical protein